MTSTDPYDVVSIGGGTAGLSGAVTFARSVRVGGTMPARMVFSAAAGMRAGAVITADPVREDARRAVAAQQGVAA